MAAVRLDNIVEQVAVDKVCLFPGEVMKVSKVRQSFKAVCVCVAGVYSDGERGDLALAAREVTVCAEDSFGKTAAKVPTNGSGSIFLFNS